MNLSIEALDVGIFSGVRANLGLGLGSNGHLTRMTTNYITQGACERHRECQKGEEKKDKSGNPSARWNGPGHCVGDPPPWVLASRVTVQLKVRAFFQEHDLQAWDLLPQNQACEMSSSRFLTLSLLSLLTNPVRGLYRLCVWVLVPNSTELTPSFCLVVTDGFSFFLSILPLV